jgi:hypothetical protein
MLDMGIKEKLGRSAQKMRPHTSFTALNTAWRGLERQSQWLPATEG